MVEAVGVAVVAVVAVTQPLLYPSPFGRGERLRRVLGVSGFNLPVDPIVRLSVDLDKHEISVGELYSGCQ